MGGKVVDGTCLITTSDNLVFKKYIDVIMLLFLNNCYNLFNTMWTLAIYTFFLKSGLKNICIMFLFYLPCLVNIDLCSFAIGDNNVYRLFNKTVNFVFWIWRATSYHKSMSANTNLPATKIIVEEHLITDIEVDIT